MNKVNFLSIASAEASDYYVAPTGNDTNTGSQASPFLTIQKAANVTIAGDIVHVLPGTYAPITINTSGTAVSPITYISDIKWGAKIVGTGNGKTKSYLVRNNASYIHFIGFDMSGTGVTDGLDNFGAFNFIQGNHIHDMTKITCSGSPGGAGLGDDAGSNNTYDGNIVNNIGDYPTKCDYVHAIYVDDTGDIVTNNIAYNNVGNGLYTNHGTGSVLFANNLSFNNKEYGVGVNGSASGNIVENNILIGNGIAAIKTWSGTSNTQISNNILFNNASNYILGGSAIQTGNQITDPKLVNYQANGTGDYHLTATSPAIDAGIATGAPMNDYDGNIRPQGLGYDIGAYEYVIPVTPTPTLTATPTPTVTPTNTPTPTLTETPTVTPTTTDIPTPTIEITPTETPTNTPVPTLTDTPTPTLTPTVTPTNSPTPTPTVTFTPTPTPQANSIGQDTFIRSNQTFWGTASDGQLWAGTANTSNAFSIASNTGKMNNTTSGGVNYDAIIGTSTANAQILFSGSITSFSSSNLGGVLRWTDTNNFYKAYIDGTNLYIQKSIAGTKTTVKSAAFSATAGTTYNIRFQVSGTTLSAKAWKVGTTEPTTWTVSATDTSFASGFVGLRALLKSGVAATYNSFSATSL